MRLSSKRIPHVIFATIFCLAPLALIRADAPAGTGTNSPPGASAPVAPPPPPAPELSKQEPGTWVEVTPPDFPIGEFGTQSVAADPVRPGDFYFMGNGHQGLWKSTDFGTTWVHSEAKFIYTMTIDPNPKRDPSTPPTLWACAGYGVGIARSTDGGQTWTTHKVGNEVAKAKDGDQRSNDTYFIAVDPTDSKHLLVTIHGMPGVSESHDSGDTWTTIKAADGNMGVSLYVFFTDPSPDEIKAGATQGSTWLTICQEGGGGGVFRTTDDGATFSQVDKLQHGHGNSQMFTAGDGVVYMGGYYGSHGNGVYRSADYGVTWTRVNDGAVENGVYGTPNFIYADDGWATGGKNPANLERAPRATGTEGTWTKYYPDTPMSNGSGHAVVAFDGKHSVILTANWKAGVWRYVEP